MMPDDVQAILPGSFRVHRRKIWTIFYYQSEFHAQIRKIFFLHFEALEGSAGPRCTVWHKYGLYRLKSNPGFC